MLPKTLSTADLPQSFQADPVDSAIRAAARRAGLTIVGCPTHGRDDCDECLTRAVRELVEEIRP